MACTTGPRVDPALVLGLVLVLAWATPASGQAPADSVESALRVPAGRVFLYSAALPGAGQRVLGSDRWIPYVAVEAWGWLRFFDRRSTGRSYEREYRDLAWSVARTISTGPRRDGTWEYYETLAKYRASGAFDLTPEQPGLQPERDETTFNGAIWALARAIYFPADAESMPPDSPQYRQALEYYRARAIRPEFAWSWGDHGEEQQSYIALIQRSDEALRAATMMLGLILANHVVSGVDALVSARLRAAGRDASPVELESGFEPGADPLRWYVGARIRLPRR